MSVSWLRDQQFIFPHVIYRTESSSSSRDAMDRRRLEMAHLEYAVLRVCSWYPHHFDVSRLSFQPGSVDDTIDAICAGYHIAFSTKYAG